MHILIRFWPWVLSAALIPIVLFVYRWGEWDFQPSWMASAKFFSDAYVPVIAIVSAVLLAYEIWSKSKADQTTLLVEGFRRQSTEMKILMPEKPDALYKISRRREVRGDNSYDENLTDFMRQHSMFCHSLMAIGYSLAKLKKVDSAAAEMLRMELFMLVERDDFHKYEYICYTFLRPKGYEGVCNEF